MNFTTAHIPVDRTPSCVSYFMEGGGRFLPLEVARRPPLQRPVAPPPPPPSPPPRGSSTSTLRNPPAHSLRSSLGGGVIGSSATSFPTVAPAHALAPDAPGVQATPPSTRGLPVLPRPVDVDAHLEEVDDVVLFAPSFHPLPPELERRDLSPSSAGRETTRRTISRDQIGVVLDSPPPPPRPGRPFFPVLPPPESSGSEPRRALDPPPRRVPHLMHA